MEESFKNHFIAPITTAEFPEVSKIERLGQKNPWSDDSLRVELADVNAFHFGAYFATGGCLSAFLLARIILDELHIHHLCTHPECRRKGLADSLLLHVLATARSRGVKKAFLEVAASNNAAIALYKKAGFTSDFTRKKYYSTDDDGIVMSNAAFD